MKKISEAYVFDFPGSDIIEKYYQFFVNDEKKKVYYKNRFLKNVIHLVNNP